MKKEDFLEDVQARALKQVLAERLADAMQTRKLAKVLMAQRMAAISSQLDRVLDPGNLSIQLDTLIKAAHVVSNTVEISLKPGPKRVMLLAC